MSDIKNAQQLSISLKEKLNDPNTVQINNNLLLEFIRSDEFTIYTNIEYLIKYAKNIGIHYILCQRLVRFPISVIQFYIPQLIQILLTVETESLALEDLILKLSKENPHFALLSFWQLQALLGDLSNDPKSYGFEVARRNLNNIQNMILDFNSSFNDDTVHKPRQKMRENVGPAVVAASIVAASIGANDERLLERIKPLVISQGKKEKSYVFTVAKTTFEKIHKTSKRLIQKSAKGSSTHSQKFNNNDFNNNDGNSKTLIINDEITREDLLFKKDRHNKMIASNNEQSFNEPQISFDIVDEIGNEISSQVMNSTKLLNKKIKRERLNKVSSHLDIDGSSENIKDNSTSIIDNISLSEEESIISRIPLKKQIKTLQMNYFKCETQFVIALESISQRLGNVPKEARLSMLRAELALMNRDLPAEVDIPTMLPRNKRGKQHKIVNIVCNEAQVLNSAEKVPYLLFVEYLKDEVDYDPTSKENHEIIKKIHNENNSSYIFDLINLTDSEKTRESIVLESSIASPINTPLEGENRRMSIIDSMNSAAYTKTDSSFDDQEMDLGEFSMASIENEANKASKESTKKQVRNNKKMSNIDKQRNKKMDELATQMRISAMMLAQLDSSTNVSNNFNGQSVVNNNKEEIEEIRKTIIQSMKQAQDQFGNVSLDMLSLEEKVDQSLQNGDDLQKPGLRKLENDLLTSGMITENPVINDDDVDMYKENQKPKTSSSYLGESWLARKERIRSESKYGHLENWELFSVIAKSGDDLRQEAFASQLILAISDMWLDARLELWLKRMKILITSPTTGLVETITDAVSVHSIKKSLSVHMQNLGIAPVSAAQANDGNTIGYVATLKDHFLQCFGPEDSYAYKKAQYNFATSLAGYSLICYLLQIKDRHNGNIMIDNEGHLIHIDFGFMLSNSPGSVGFEAAPFKLTFEYVDVLGGLESDAFKKFKTLLKDGFKVLRNNHEQIVSMCEIMQKESLQPCFQLGEQTSVQLKQRFAMHLNSEKDVDRFVEDYLIGRSLGSMYTRIYDQFQLLTQGIYS
ncbi:related to Phosphatidylinositol 4-kinase PIK1 [Hanseniaspora guilliermondii]|uniref:1-phosphatidylinositol 4-kinase n=1 Tax=Hanseniaspora guilliermondii TaxID=56406 RepID=A0A1L0B353_9ASCO|nr:related to Phosphatidylinositol 4-kinase PIK1 [Hanseniaspora guilliermondii]